LVSSLILAVSTLRLMSTFSLSGESWAVTTNQLRQKPTATRAITSKIRKLRMMCLGGRATPTGSLGSGGVFGLFSMIWAFVELAEDLIHRHGSSGRDVRQPLFDGHHGLGQLLVGADAQHFAKQRHRHHDDLPLPALRLEEAVMLIQRLVEFIGEFWSHGHIVP
jgi:hypothetical protein